MWTAFGIFLGFVANAAVYSVSVDIGNVYPGTDMASFGQYGANAWRWQLAGPIVPTVPLLVMLQMCPESPAWYIKNGEQYDKAFQSLCRLRNTEIQAAKDVYSIYLQRRAKAKTGSLEESTFGRKVLELLTKPRIRRATTASYVVMLSQQLCGSKGCVLLSPSSLTTSF